MKKKSAPKVGILMGSDSDWPTMKAAADALAEFGIVSEVRVISEHRTPQDLARYAGGAHKRGLGVIIAGAGGAAPLPGVTAAFTALPVIERNLAPYNPGKQGNDQDKCIMDQNWNPKNTPDPKRPVHNKGLSF